MDRLDVLHASLTPKEVEASEAMRPWGPWAALCVARYRHEADPDLGLLLLESTSERAGAP